MLLNSVFSLITGTLQNTLRCRRFDVYSGFYQYICRHQFRYKSTFLSPIGPINGYLVNLNYYSHNNDSFKDLPFIEFGSLMSEEEKKLVVDNMLVFESFLSTEEEKTLLNEIEPYMKRLRYEFTHWDNAIHGYRETERLKWKEENLKIINRVRDCAFQPGSPQLHHVHILDLAEDGYIKPHIDSVRFCGNTIAGLSLLTDSVMRLVHEQDKSKTVDVLLKRYSLYVMRDTVRYDFTHEILPNNESKFRQQRVDKKRRISIICRNEPSSSSKPSPST